MSLQLMWWDCLHIVCPEQTDAGCYVCCCVLDTRCSLRLCLCIYGLFLYWKQLQLSVMCFHLPTLLFFPCANWCGIAVGIEKIGLKCDFSPMIDLDGIIGSSDRCLKIEWIDKPCEKARKRRNKKSNDEHPILMLLNWACFQVIAGNSSERSNSISAFVKDKIKANAKVCLPF